MSSVDHLSTEETLDIWRQRDHTVLITARRKDLTVDLLRRIQRRWLARHLRERYATIAIIMLTSAGVRVGPEASVHPSRVIAEQLHDNINVIPPS